MKIYSVLFGNDSRFIRMAAALEKSGKKNSPRTPIQILEPEYPVDQIMQMRNNGHRGTWIDNAHKTKYHKDIIDQSEDGQLLCLMDCDMLIVGDFFPITHFAHFDLAYTVRESDKGRINSGVIFVRVSEKIRTFYHLWYQNVLDLLASRTLFDRWTKKYGGINQCGLGMLLESNKHYLEFMELPCSIWNLCYDQWQFYNPAVKAIHYHGVLRHLATKGCKPSTPDSYKKLAEIWRKYD